MTEQSQFFSDGSYYSQNVFSRVWKDIFGQNGVFDGIDDELEVEPTNPAGLSVLVNTGRSFVQGYFHEILTDPVQLTISAADTTNPRIDRIVLRLDVDTNRKIAVAVLEGTPAASPVAPTLTQTDSIYEISLAQIAVAANATSIVAGNITDERTYATYKRDNMPLTSSTEFGAMKVGTGLASTNGVVRVNASSYPLVAKMFTTDTGYETLIKNNVYNGTVGQTPSAVVIQNKDTLQKSYTYTITFTSTYTTTFEVWATNVFTGAKTRTLHTGTMSSTTHSETYTDTLYAEEIVGGWFTGSTGSTQTVSVTNATPDIYLGQPD